VCERGREKKCVCEEEGEPVNVCIVRVCEREGERNSVCVRERREGVIGVCVCVCVCVFVCVCASIVRGSTPAVSDSHHPRCFFFFFFFQASDSPIRFVHHQNPNK
jgi:hypothetical protein